MRGWHVPSGQSLRGLSVGDVIRYERDALGNDNAVDERRMAEFDRIPARRCCWATRTQAASRRYGRGAVQVAGEVIGQDGDGGYLLLLD